MPLQIRRGTEAERQSAVSLVPQSGELVWITDTEQLYVGDGTNQLKNLSPITGYSDEFAIDAVGQALAGGTHSGITFTYGATQDAADRIDATINPTQSLTNLTVTGNTSLSTTTINGSLTVSGKLTADFNGSIYADDSMLLVDGVDSKINLDGTVKGNIIPDVTEAYDIGSSSLKFKDLYLSGTSLFLGDAQITSTSTAINLPAGSTIDGEIIQSEVSDEDAFVRDLQGSVFGDDSTLLVDGVNSRLTTGNISLQGNNITYDTTELLIGHEDLSTSGARVTFRSTANEPNITLQTTTDGTQSGGISFNTSRTGIDGNEVIVQANDPLGFEIASGWDGSTHQITSVVAHRVDPNGSVSAGTVPGTINLFTYTDGNLANYKGVTIDRLGWTSINKTTAAQATLDINGFAKLQPLSAAPGTLVNGLIAIDDGTTNWSGHASGVQAVVAYINTGWVKLNN